MAQARQYSAVTPVLPDRLVAVADTLKARLCMLAGLVLVVDSLTLMLFFGVFSFGVVLPLVLGAALLALGARWQLVHTRWLGTAGRRRAWQLGWLAMGLWATSVAAFWIYLGQEAKNSSSIASTPAAIIVLGSGSPRGRPSPTLKARLDLGLAQARQHPDAYVVVSGGTGWGEKYSEGQIMGDYLRSADLASSRIFQEERSNSTEENLIFSHRLLQQSGLPSGAAVQVITSDFHTVRTRWIAHRAGYTNVSIAGAPTPLYLRYNAWLREYFAVLSSYLLGEY